MFAGAGDHQCPSLAFVVQVAQHLVKFAPKGRVHGVHALGLVQHQVGDMVIRRQGKAAECVHRVGFHEELEGLKLVNCNFLEWQALSLA